MANPAPVLTVAGRVHSVRRRRVDAVEQQTERRDPVTNEVTQRAREPRAAYDTTDVTLLTEKGGFATIVCSDDDAQLLGFDSFDALVGLEQTDVSWPVRAFVKWDRRGDRSWPSAGLSVAGDVAARDANKSEGRRLAPTG